MAKVFPRIGRVLKQRLNHQAKCKCGKVGKFKTEIHYNYMRGDDDQVWSCDAHAKDLTFLLGGD